MDVAKHFELLDLAQIVLRKDYKFSEPLSFRFSFLFWSSHSVFLPLLATRITSSLKSFNFKKFIQQWNIFSLAGKQHNKEPACSLKQCSEELFLKLLFCTMCLAQCFLHFCCKPEMHFLQHQFCLADQSEIQWTCGSPVESVWTKKPDTWVGTQILVGKKIGYHGSAVTFCYKLIKRDKV